MYEYSIKDLDNDSTLLPARVPVTEFEGYSQKLDETFLDVVVFVFV